MVADIKEKFPNLIENAAMAVLYLDRQGNVLYCNRKTETLLGAERGDFLNKNWLDVLFKNSVNAMKKEMFKAVM